MGSGRLAGLEIWQRAKAAHTCEGDSEEGEPRQAQGEGRAAWPQGLGRRVVQDPQLIFPSGTRSLNVEMWAEDEVPEMGQGGHTTAEA